MIQIRLSKDYHQDDLFLLNGDHYTKTEPIDLSETDYKTNNEIKQYLRQGTLVLVKDGGEIVSKRHLVDNETGKVSFKEIVSEDNDEEMNEAKKEASENDELVEELKGAD